MGSKRPVFVLQTGLFSFMYVGKWVDAIDHLEGDLKKAEEEVERVASPSELVHLKLCR